MDNRNSGVRCTSWVWIAAVWLGFGLLDAIDSVLVMHAEGMHHAWGKLFIANVLSWIPWALATAPAMRLNQRFPITQWRSSKTWLVHLSAYLVLDFGWTAWYTALELLLNPYAAQGPP